MNRSQAGMQDWQHGGEPISFTPESIPDPIASRIDGYLSDLARLESEFTTAREALHTAFKADVTALVHNGNGQVSSEQQMIALVEQGLRRVISEGMRRYGAR